MADFTLFLMGFKTVLTLVWVNADRKTGFGETKS